MLVQVLVEENEEISKSKTVAKIQSIHADVFAARDHLYVKIA